MAVSYNRVAVVSLYRNLLKNAVKFVNYNFRDHAQRRVMVEFRNNKELPVVEAEEKFKWGCSQLDMLRRQATISQLYPEETSVAADKKRLRRNSSSA
jgi:LYR motif-containing protein 4